MSGGWASISGISICCLVSNAFQIDDGYESAYSGCGLHYYIDTMFRKITASVFLIVMALLIALKHPVLGYCLCIDSYFAGNCACQAEQPVTTALDNATCPGCCPSGASGLTAPEFAEQSPCSVCEEVLMVDVGDFIWHGGNEMPEGGESVATSPAIADAASVLPKAYVKAAMSARGDPPPILRAGMPLYLRHSILRL